MNITCDERKSGTAGKSIHKSDSQPGQNFVLNGQKFNNTLQDNSQLTLWTKCDATWSEIQQHIARQQSTYHLDKM
jgi:hypothetical protein